MINDLIINLIGLFNNLISSFGIVSHIQQLLDELSVFESYADDIQYYLSGAYFIFGKPLLIFVLTVSSIVFLIKLAGALVMIIGQFVP